ncbi:MAG: DUF3750 domain-containing protein [Pseudomonadota bacterium]
MRRLLSSLFAFLFLIFIAPALVHIGVWWWSDPPRSWRDANWDSAGILPQPRQDEAALYLMSARTGGMKGALATHSWVVLKKPGEARYQRFDKVGWGRPVRRNSFAADGNWYSNPPRIVWQASGTEAAALLPQVEKAIANYAHQQPGDYGIWPGPNSNTFIAHVVRSVPGFASDLPGEAVGRDYPKGNGWLWRDASGALRGSLGGFAGFAVGGTAGFELNFLGLVAGFDWQRGEVKVPGFGSMRVT